MIGLGLIAGMLVAWGKHVMVRTHVYAKSCYLMEACDTEDGKDLCEAMMQEAVPTRVNDKLVAMRDRIRKFESELEE